MSPRRGRRWGAHSRPTPSSARPAPGATSAQAITPSSSWYPLSETVHHLTLKTSSGVARRRGGRVPPRAEPREDPRSEYPAYPAHDEPECVEPGLWRISVPLPFALRTANIYLLADGASGWTLIDSGLGLPADEEALRGGLARAGVALSDISALVLTHAPPDHIGL